VWVLSPPGEFPRHLYRDGFHLNDQGSEMFTSRLAEQIRKMGSESPNLREQKDMPR
jgi:lysophospholipase L1-like esterase